MPEAASTTRGSAGRSRRNARVTVAVGLLLAFPVPAVAQGGGPGRERGPAEDVPTEDVPIHDPVMIREGGTWWAFATGRGVAVWSSEDMEHWDRRPPVFAEPPAWAAETVPGFRGSLWAPDISYHEGLYHLFYSVSAFGKNTSAIGVATTSTLDPDDPDFGWTDHGPVVQSVPGRDLWNAIDPNLMVDDQGTPWLVFGSFWHGLKLVQLDPDMTRPAPGAEWRTVAARARDWAVDDDDPGPGAIEAPFLFRKDGWYYLFVSWDLCCRGLDSTYKVAVGRSRDVRGPYLDREGRDMRDGGGTPVVEGFGEGHRWVAGGHNAAYPFDGTDYLVLHGYDARDRGRSKLIVRPVRWDEDGWPTVDVAEPLEAEGG